MKFQTLTGGAICPHNAKPNSPFFARFDEENVALRMHCPGKAPALTPGSARYELNVSN